VIDIFKGNDIEAIIAGMTDAKSRTGKGNQFVLLHTKMGNGVDFMMYTLMEGTNDAQLETHSSKSRNLR
jgi:transketolase